MQPTLKDPSGSVPNIKAPVFQHFLVVDAKRDLVFAEIIDYLHASADLLSLHLTDTRSTSQLRQFHMTKASLEVDLALFHDRGESDEAFRLL